MKKILVIADQLGGDQRVIARGIELARKTGAELVVAGFVFEHIESLPIDDFEDFEQQVKAELLEAHRKQLLQKFRELKGEGKAPAHSVDVHWEDRVADRVIERVSQEGFDLVLKRVHRSATLTYTPTDWQLLRRCPCSVMLVADKLWKRGRNIMAAVDLGTRMRGKRALNNKVAEEAGRLAAALECRLVIGYAVPLSDVLQDIDLIDEEKLQRNAQKRLTRFCDSLEAREIKVDDQRLVTGAPEKALVSAAAHSRAGLLVLGCVGRKSLAGKVIGNTAEQILRFANIDILAVKPS